LCGDRALFDVRLRDDLSMTAAADPPGGNPQEALGLYSKQGQRVGYALAFFTLASAVLGGLLVGTGWSWPLFAWGAVVAIGSAVASRAVQKVGYSSLGLAMEADSPQVHRLKERNRAVYPPAVLSFLGVAIFGAAIVNPWPDIALTIYVVLTGIVLPLAMLPSIKRRAAVASARRDGPAL
jgi:hypothetical protein